MSDRPMDVGTNTIELDRETVKEVFQTWVRDQFLPFDNKLEVLRVHVTRSGKFQVTLRGKKAHKPIIAALNPDKTVYGKEGDK